MLWIGVERVDLPEDRIVVRGRPAEPRIESADDRERAADAEIAVEIELVGNDDVGFVVAGGPGEMRIAEENGVTRRGTTRRECPCVGAVVGIRARRGGGACRERGGLG